MWDYGNARHTTDDNIIRRMCFARWVTNITDKNSVYAIPTALPWQQWLHKRASRLCYMYNVTSYVHCPSCSETE